MSVDFKRIKKYFKASKDIDEKLEYLNKELKKTGLREAMTTNKMYQMPNDVPNQDYINFNGLSQGGYALGLSGADGNSLGGAINGINPSTNQPGVALSPPHPVFGTRRVASTVLDGVGSNRALRPGKGTRFSSGPPPRTITDGSAVWFFDPNYASGEGQWFNFEWFDGKLGFWDTNFLGFFFHNTNLDDFQLSGVNVGTQIKNKIDSINFGANGEIGAPQTTVLTQTKLDDSGFLPINIDLSIQAFNSLKEKAKEFFNKGKDKGEEEVESMMDKLKDHWNQSWEDVKKFPKDLKKFGKDLVNMIDEVTDAIPALDYSKDIAVSILSNEPKDNSDKITEEDKQKLYDGLNYNVVKINDKKETYADDNIIEDENGNVRPREQWPTDKNGDKVWVYNEMTEDQKAQFRLWRKDNEEHPNNTNPVQTMESEKEMQDTMGASNPLAAAGQAQVQVYKNKNGEWVFSYTDHAYHNINSTDEGEVPGLGFLNPKLWISKAVHKISNVMYDRTSGGENTGGMEGYPSGIYGDSIKKFETKVDDMPKKFQDWFNNKINQNNSYRLRGKESLNESVRLGHFDPEVLNVDIEQLRKGIMPEFPKDPPPEMIDGYSAKSRLAPKKIEKDPFIKITKKDLAKNHKLTDKEISDFMNDIKMINDYIKKNPADLIYAQQRYPKHDSRLAQLNWQMDQMLNAGKEYIDKQFPENQKLFDKIKKKIKNTIDQTDPKNFKGTKLPKFDKTHLEDFKRKKEVYSRFMKKPVKTKKLFQKRG